MVTVAAIGQYILDINGYKTPSKTIVENMVDDAIHSINSQCGTTIADLAGDAESKTLTGTEDELAAVKLLSSMKLRSRNSRGPSIGLGPLAKSGSAVDPDLKEELDRLLGNLKGLPIIIKNDPLPTE